MADYEVAIQVDDRFAGSVSERALIDVARRVLAAEEVDVRRDLSVVIADDETVRDLNRRFRDEDAPTDVLSFSLETEGDFVTPPESGRQLGEVVISYPTALRQAEEACHDVGSEIEHLLAHGILHLLGYDHEEEEEAREMRRREERVLGGVRH